MSEGREILRTAFLFGTDYRCYHGEQDPQCHGRRVKGVDYNDRGYHLHEEEPRRIRACPRILEIGHGAATILQ